MNDRSHELCLPGTALLPPNLAVEGTRRRILEGALLLFASEGFHASSMRELAKVVELQPSALYVHFASKEHLLAELVRAGHEAHHQSLRAALSEAGAEPLAQLRALVGAHVRIHASHPHLAIVVNSQLEALSPDLAAPGLALRKQSIALLREVLERGAATGVFSVPDTTVTAAAISAMGLRVPYWYAPSPELPMDRMVEAHVELAVRMVGAGRVDRRGSGPARRQV
jgi:AcrR family transcriptional regulator